MPRRDFAEFAGAIQQASRKRALEKKGKIPARLAVHSAIERVNCAGPAGRRMDRTPEPAHRRSHRRRQKLDCLRARPQGLSGYPMKDQSALADVAEGFTAS